MIVVLSCFVFYRRLMRVHTVARRTRNPDETQNPETGTPGRFGAVRRNWIGRPREHANSAHARSHLSGEFIQDHYLAESAIRRISRPDSAPCELLHRLARTYFRPMANDAAPCELRASTAQPGADGVRCPRTRETATEHPGRPSNSQPKTLTG